MGRYALEHERCGEMIERIGLQNFLDGIGEDVDPNMVANPRESSYVRVDDWDDEAKKWYVVNRFNGAVQVVVSESRMKAMEQGRSIFGQVALDLYAVN